MFEFTRLTARDLQDFLVFSQHPVWFIAPVKPIEKVVYRFYEITMEKICQ